MSIPQVQTISRRVLICIAVTFFPPINWWVLSYRMGRRLPITRFCPYPVLLAVDGPNRSRTWNTVFARIGNDLRILDVEILQDLNKRSKDLVHYPNHGELDLFGEGWSIMIPMRPFMAFKIIGRTTKSVILGTLTDHGSLGRYRAFFRDNLSWKILQ